MDDDGRTVILLGDYNGDYYREVSLRDGLRAQGVTVHECRYRDEPLFLGPKKLSLLPVYYLRIWRGVRRITRESEDEIDAILVTKFNPLILPIAALLAWRLGATLVYDLFVSLARTVELRDYDDWKVKIVYLIEYFALRLPDLNLTETDAFSDLYTDYYNLPRKKLLGVPVGAEDTWFHPDNMEDAAEEFTVVYWGNFLPHHGLDTVIDAAERLRDEDVCFEFYGEGPERKRIQSLVDQRGLNDVSFHGRVPWEELSVAAASGDIALGIFADDMRSDASITNKVSEAVAAGTAVVTMDARGVREWFEHGEDIYLVPPANGDALAEAILTLRENPDLRKEIGSKGRETYEQAFSIERIGATIMERLGWSTLDED
ncbi:glycosyltransferase family 4 protein [Haloarchaeobius amylolyticus]|uniref:glycosyltransferase family 4 protein n=1 Tax=Haloarchaeobius amylolyticus TaxID=1198296 RepID=UPI00226F7015|nr:glycosyltransferase family 4 protein [Haloarchaeobius amylolyticus]